MDEKVIKTIESLKSNQFDVRYFEESKEAVEYLLSAIPESLSVGIGGSMTIKSLGIIDKFKDRGNKVLFHWLVDNMEEANKIRREALEADVYMASSNALTMDGKLVNIDGIGNRVSGMFFNYNKVYIVCGVNKIVENVDKALERVKSIVHLNSVRAGLDTPCIETGVCIDCKSPQRACSITTITEFKPMYGDIEIIIINEKLGF